MVASSSNKTQQQLPIPPPPQTLHPDDVKSTREWLSAQNVPEKKQQTPQPKAAARSEEEIKAAKAAKRRRQREGKKAAATAAASGDDKADDEPKPNDPMVKPDPGSSAAGGSGGSGGKGEDSSASSEVPMVKAPAVKETPEPGSSAAGGSGAIGTGSYGADDDDKPKHQLDCNNARVCGSTNLLWSQFLLDSPDASMDGRIWGLCFDCSGMDAKTFKRECRSRREGRAKLMRGRRDRARCIRFSNVAEIIKQMVPQASHAVQRDLAIKRTRAMAMAWMAGFDKLNPEVQKISHEINQEWLNAIETAAEDPSYACPVDAHTLTAWEASYLTSLGNGWAFSFQCRMPGCLYFGLNSQWVEHVHHYWFKCPLCGEQYHRSSDYKNAVAAAFVLQITDPITGDLSLIPTVWPPSEDMQWLNKQIELPARDIQTPADVAGWYSKSKLDLKALIDRAKIPVGLKKYEVSSSIDGRFSSSRRWEEFKARGHFWGNQLNDETVARTPYSNWNELIGLISNTVASSRAIASRSAM